MVLIVKFVGSDCHHSISMKHLENTYPGFTILESSIEFISTDNGEIWNARQIS